mgnify:CR=1 FL=1
MSKTKVLIVEDDHALSDVLFYNLQKADFNVFRVFDGRDGLEQARQTIPDIVVLDLMLPRLGGMEVCRQLRKQKETRDIGILMLTAKEAIEDRVAGLDAGADDYLVKPFAFDELMARVRALLRRAQPNLPQVYRFADLELDTGTRQGRRGGVTFDLTAKEYELLELFMRHPRQVLTRDVIFDRVWNYDFGGESNIIEVYVRYLRQKTEQGGMLRLIHTVRGIGYVLREES